MDGQLSNADERVFLSFFQRRIVEAGGAKDDGEELALARDILAAVVRDGLTPTPDGGASYVRRGAVDWTDPTTVQAAQAALAAQRPNRRAARSKSELWQGVGLMAAAVVAITWFVWPFGGTSDEQRGTSEEQEMIGGEATAEAEIEVTPAPTLEAEVLAEVVGAGVRTKKLVVPRTLEIKGVNFVVQPVKVEAGLWPLPEIEQAASWVHGTVINYVLGLASTPENKQLLASLQPGDSLLLRISTGPVYRFLYADTVKVAPQASEIFGQNRPGLTLVLVEDDAVARVVVRGLYVAETESEQSSAAVKDAQLGERVVLEDRLRLTVLSQELVSAGVEMPGYVYLRLEVALEAVQGQPLPTAPFVHQLEAGSLRYPLAGAGSTPLPEELSPRRPVTTTLVYALPKPALAEALAWLFSLDPAGGAQARVTLPAPDGRLEPTVQLLDVVAENGTLVLSLSIEAGLEPVSLTSADITLQGGALSPLENVFPWQVPPGEQDELALVVRPEASGRVVVTLLDQGIEVSINNEQ